MISRSQKNQLVKDISEKFDKSRGVFLFEYHGLNVGDITGLRKKMKEGGGELKVFKNTLVKRAIKGSEADKHLSESLKGPIACAFSYEDAVPAAKTLVDFEKDEKRLAIKAGILKDKKITFEQIKRLAKLPSREVLLAQLVGTLAAPMRALVTVLSAVPRDFIYVLKAIEQKKPKG